jgi:hypothetical protein
MPPRIGSKILLSERQSETHVPVTDSLNSLAVLIDRREILHQYFLQL